MKHGKQFVSFGRIQWMGDKYFLIKNWRGATQKSCTIFLTLKGRNIPAQGNALGKYKKEFLAL